MCEQILRPKGKVSSQMSTQQVEFQDAVILDIRRILNQEGFHAKSPKWKYGYKFRSYESATGEKLLLFSMSIEEKSPYSKLELAKRIFEILKRTNYDVSFTEKKGSTGLQVNLRKNLAEKKESYSSQKLIQDEDVFLRFVTESSDEVQLKILNNIRKSALLHFLGKKLS
jgi:hypothetical protein